MLSINELKTMSRRDMDNLAAALYGTAENCEGNIEERFIAGWVNAMDTELDYRRVLDEEEFKALVLYAVNV